MHNRPDLIISEKSINWDFAKKQGKEKFLKAHSHLKSEKHLSEMYDKKFPKKK